MEVLRNPALSPLWRGARQRLERNGLSLEGSPVVLRDLNTAEANAIAGLIGVPLPPAGSPLKVRLAILDDRLRRSAAQCGLLELLIETGGAVVDRPALRERARATAAERRQELFGHPALTALPELRPWLQRVLAEGTHRRVVHGDESASVDALVAALDVLGALRQPSDGRLLPVLAADVHGDAHLLDRGRPVGSLMVNALASIADSPLPTTAAGWRSLWATAGVVCDDLSCDVLVLNLPRWGPGRGPWRLTLRQASKWAEAFAGAKDISLKCTSGAVFACENPAVVAAAEEAFGPAGPTMVCLDGMPSTAALTVLDALSPRASEVRYHGDFDWRGLAIANVLARRINGVASWRYRAVDYLEAVARGRGSVQLVGRQVESPFDPELGSAMAAAGLAIYEEQVIAELLGDLTGAPEPA
jgi:uncharacterized protein (TIGR02679 family)